MKILTILGSHRKQGNTAAILHLIEERLQIIADNSNEQLTIDRINMRDINIQPCKGCRICFDRGETFCPNKDDLLAVKSRIDSADAIVCSSPVYVGDLSGSLKTLIDRLAFICHRPAFYGKSIFLIASTGGSPVFGTLKSMATAFLSMGGNILGWKGFSTGARMPHDQINQKYERDTRKIANKVFIAVDREKALKPSLISLIMFRIQQATWSKKQDDTMDYQYWHTNGWTDLNKTFFIQNHANIVWVAIAWVIGQFLSFTWR